MRAIASPGGSFRHTNELKQAATLCQNIKTQTQTAVEMQHHCTHTHTGGLSVWWDKMQSQRCASMPKWTQAIVCHVGCPQNRNVCKLWREP